MRWFKHSFSNSVYARCFKNFFGAPNILLNDPLKMGDKMKKTLRQANSVETIFTWNTKMLFCFWLEVYVLFIYLFIYLFSNGHIHNVVLTLPNIVIIDVESDNIVSTLSKVVEINVEIDNLGSMLFSIVNPFTDAHNVVSTLIWRCATSRRISTWKQR